MRLDSPFTYELPKERIAQRPCHPADHARMLVIDRKRGVLSDQHFFDLPTFLTSHDRLVFNDTRVIPARLFGTLTDSDGPPIELLLVEKVSESVWVCLGRPLKKIRNASRICFSETLTGSISRGSGELDRVTVEFHTTETTHISMAIAQHGSMPIPPYIRGGKGDELDEIDYQSIFAQHPGSIAAPTASLHFNDRLIETLTKETKCSLSKVTLHVGTASFLPVLEDGKLRPPGAEQLHIDEGVTDQIGETKTSGGRVIGVGTTVVRALESSASNPSSEYTELFITPGYEFSVVDAVITNFHQPGTTHLLLVEALMGRELLAQAYAHALAHDYRFLSYGDGMLIL